MSISLQILFIQDAESVTPWTGSMNPAFSINMCAGPLTMTSLMEWLRML